MEIDSEEVSDYIRSLVKGVEQGIPTGYFPSAPMKIEIGITNVVEKDGSVRLYVAGIGGKLKGQQHAKVEIELTNPLTEETKKLWERWMKTIANPSG